jgi:glycine oxidase
MAKSYDVVIVGGGIIGTSCALALAEEGMSVVVLDRQEPGREASWAAAGMLSPAPHLAGDEGLVPLASESLRLYPNFIHAIESVSQKTANYSRKGAIEVFFGVDGPAERDRSVESCRRLGLHAEAISATEARHREPAIASTARAATFFPAEESVEPRALFDAALEAARARGVEIRPHCTVHSLAIERDGCAGVMMQDERLAAGIVVVAAGCFSRQIFPENSYWGRRLAPFVPTRPVRGQLLALLPLDTRLDCPVRSARGYLVPRSSGTIIAGSTIEEAGFDKRTTIEGLQKIRKTAVELVPDLAGAEIIESWCGLRPGTPDGLPILGPVDIEGIILATGHFRNGILLAPVTARLVKDWVTGKAPSLPVEAYSPHRFVRSAAESHSAS